MALTVLLGGARSGKSALAVRLASADEDVVFVATAEARDAEMTERIRQHRAERPESWSTVEEPIDLGGAIRAAPPDACVIVDCLSLWVSNLLEADWGDEEIEQAAGRAAENASARRARTIVVSNEVGLGVVPATRLGRRYRDVLGRVNEAFTSAAEEAAFVVAGRALRLEAWT